MATIKTIDISRPRNPQKSWQIARITTTTNIFKQIQIIAKNCDVCVCAVRCVC